MKYGVQDVKGLMRKLARADRLRPLRILARDCRGATAIEYALLAALVALGISASVLTLGDTLKVPFENVASGLGAGDDEPVDVE